MEPRLAIDSPFTLALLGRRAGGLHPVIRCSAWAAQRRAVNDPQGLPRHLGKRPGAALGWDDA
jgi:hypothetical protein